ADKIKTIIAKWSGYKSTFVMVRLSLAKVMQLRAWATGVAWLGLIFFVGLVEVTLVEGKARKWKSKVHVKRIVEKPSQSHQRHNNRHTYSRQHLSSDNFAKRQLLGLNSKKNDNFTFNVITRSTPSNLSYGTVSKLKRSFGSYPQKESQNKKFRRRRKLPDYTNAPSMPGRWNSNVLEGTGRDEDGLIKRSRNRVRLKTQRSHRRKIDSSNGFTAKQNVVRLSSNEPDDANIPKEKKRQHIAGGITYTDGPNVFGNGNANGISNEGFAGNPDSFFADPMAARADQRALHLSHFFAPAVHKFLPAEHRYPSAPIHRYLSSPVIFKDAHREGYPAPGGGENSLEGRAVAGPAGPFNEAPMTLFNQGPPHHGHRVIVINRPIHTPVPLPVNGPPRVVLVHHPVPLPPQRFPVPVMPRPPPFVIVHHREFSGPAIDPCGVNPCRNGGTCTAVITDFKCICPMGYKGDRCEVQSRCIPNPCKNFGKCTELPDDFECTCHTGFHGKACDLESKCEPNPCRNGGVCTENVDSYICSCAAGFMGKNCEQESKCLPVNPCKNGGMCTEDLSGYKCNCKDGYNGINCEVRETSTACDSYPCRNGATCIADIYDPSRYSCYCASGFTGLSCEDRGFESLALSTSPCNPFNPCLFGGHCLPDGEDYTCLCPEGRGGSHCEHFFQESSCNGCHHHAVCISSKCTCRQGYSGDGRICRPKISQCHPNPCENGGTCRDEDAADSHQPDWWCECPKGYSGRRCHVYDPCSNFKCHNGGTCESTNNEPRCKCAAPFEGTSCLLDNSCLPKNGENRNPCKNGGKCEFTNGEVKCVCPVQYEGPTCSVNKCDKCGKHAFCDNGICKCKPPYIGDGITCKEPEEPPARAPPTAPSELSPSCNPNKCLNGAACVEGKDTFYCVCKENTSGRLCEKKTTPTTAPPKAVCHPNPCLNGGMCKETGSNQDFDCICPNPRFKGRFCDVDMCAECDPHARCINGKCFCRRGYTGDGFSCKRVKPKNKCPQYATTISGDICICNPGYYMSNTGKRACIPNTDISRTTLQHEPKIEIPPPAEGAASRTGQQWSEDIIVTEYRSLGCWSDTTDWRDSSKRAMMVMEGLDPILADNYHERKQPISKCADVAKRLGFHVFAVQNGGQCFGGADENNYKTYGPSEKCADGVGGSLANDVYKL
ncbi:hypothetical protein ACROYT_G030906, partial [Oculina patagonica]